jgi:hypothetical protein
MTAQDLPDTGALAQLSYELSLRTLSQQESSPNELRGRTGTLIAAAALVASFLRGAAISRDGIDGWSVVALIAFVASIGLATGVFPPKEHLIFSVHGSALYEDEIRDDVFEIAETSRGKLNPMAEPPAPPPPPPPNLGAPETRSGGNGGTIRRPNGS